MSKLNQKIKKHFLVQFRYGYSWKDFRIIQLKFHYTYIILRYSIFSSFLKKKLYSTSINNTKQKDLRKKFNLELLYNWEKKFYKVIRTNILLSIVLQFQVKVIRLN